MGTALDILKKNVTILKNEQNYYQNEGEKMNPVAVNVDGFPVSPYSHAIIAGGLVYVAGQTGMDYSTGNISNDFEKQARQAFKNLAAVLNSAGSKLELVVKTTVWLKDPANFDTLNKLYKEFFPQNAPARSTPVVDLPRQDLQISIEAIALAK